MNSARIDLLPDEVTIYPVYAVSLLIASVPAVIAGTLPSGWVLLMQVLRSVKRHQEEDSSEHNIHAR